MKLYLCDANMIATGKTVEYDEKSGKALPARAIDVEPPKGIAQWAGNRWIVLGKYPDSPPPAEKPAYTKEDYENKLSTEGLLDAVKALIDERVEAKLREGWDSVKSGK